MPRPLTFRRGIGTGSSSVFGLMPVPDPTLAAVYHDDFFEYTAADWVLGGTGSPGRTTLDNADGGLLRLSTSAAGGDSSTAHWAGGNGAIRRGWTFTAGKRMGIKTRFRISENNVALFIGLADAITPAAGWAATNDFAISAGPGGFGVRVTKAGSSANAANIRPTSFPANTFVELAAIFNGSDQIQGFLNGNLFAELRSSTLISALAPTAAMGVGVGVLNATGVARNVDIDYITVIKER
jgi:hypothetical protein